MALIPKEVLDQVKRWLLHEPILNAAFEASKGDDGAAVAVALLQYIEAYRDSMDRLVKITTEGPPPAMIGDISPLLISKIKNLVGNSIVSNDNGIQVTVVIPKNSWELIKEIAKGE